MSVNVIIELPDDTFSVLNTEPEAFVRELRIAAGSQMVRDRHDFPGQSSGIGRADSGRFYHGPFPILRITVSGDTRGTRAGVLPWIVR